MIIARKNLANLLKNSMMIASKLYTIPSIGVGGAVIAGYREAIEAGADVIVKVDGDGQMDLSKLSLFVEPIVRSKCDYTKGNRLLIYQVLIRCLK